MSAPIKPPAGCGVCGTQDTATVDGVCGRRCAQHPPTFRPRHAVNLAITLGAPTAMAYVRTELPS